MVDITVLYRKDNKTALITIPPHNKPILIEVLEGGMDKLLFKEVVVKEVVVKKRRK